MGCLPFAFPFFKSVGKGGRGYRHPTRLAAATATASHGRKMSTLAAAAMPLLLRSLSGTPVAYQPGNASSDDSLAQRQPFQGYVFELPLDFKIARRDARVSASRALSL